MPLYLLDNHATPHTQADFEAILERVAEEPRDILKQNRHLSPSDVEQIDQIKTLKAAYQWREYYGDLTIRLRRRKNGRKKLEANRRGLNHAFLSVLEKAAADLLVRIYALYGIPAEWLAGTWEEEGPLLKEALLLFLYERDAPDAEHGRAFRAPKPERKDALRKLLERTIEGLHKELGRRPKAREIWDSLADYDEDQIIDPIQDVDDVIYWGRERKTTYKAIQNRLTELFKKNPKKIIPVIGNAG